MNEWLRKPAPWLSAALIIVTLKSLVLGYMLWDRISILRSDTQIVLQPEPIDPRDLFRGDYVILNYGISRFPTKDGEEREELPPSRMAWAVIAQDPEGGGWRVRSLSIDRPQTLPQGAIALRAERPNRTNWRNPRLKYGIERYYVPEGEGRRLEDLIRERADAIKVTVAISDDGRAAIKGLQVDGETVFEEPLF